jgi:nucleoside-diphosphate-sugar epimerase
MIVGITGGTGFIGKKLIDHHLAQGHRVRVLSRRARPPTHPGAEVVQGDLCNGVEPLRGFVDGLDVLYHCAAELRDQARMQTLHVQGTADLLRAASGVVGRFVHLSSVGVYGQHKHGAITENTPQNPEGAYEVTKAASDRLVVEEGERTPGFGWTILRPSIVFGATMTNRSLFQLVSMVNRGLFFFIGSEGASANYVHVDNVVAALALCARAPAAGRRIFNLSDHRTIERFVGEIAGLLGRAPPRVRLPEPLARLAVRLGRRLPRFPLTDARIDALVNRSAYPIDRIVLELGYRHPVSMESGLRDLVDGWRAQASAR